VKNGFRMQYRLYRDQELSIRIKVLPENDFVLRENYFQNYIG
jgi:hypothetical protein